MQLCRRIRLLVIVLLVGLALAAPTAFAATPCAEGGMSSEKAQQAAEDCCDMSPSVTALCIAKCTDGSKLAAQGDVPVVKAPRERMLLVAYPVSVLPARSAWATASGLDPPKTIRFCTFLI
jgi:hypothetical protein